MNKHDFLRELKRNVAMLEDAEQNDIINEYSQHIDMKVQGGMSEEEAIADFGSIDELVEEILAAYHVKAPEKEATAAQSFVDGSKKAATAAASATKHGWTKLKEGTKRCVDELDELAEERAQQKAEREGATPRSLWSTLKGALLTCARWFWNFCVACAAFGCLLVAVGAVFSFGFCVILMVQGYPLAGITIAFFGGAVAAAALTLLVIRLLWLKKPATGSSNAPTTSAENDVASSAGRRVGEEVMQSADPKADPSTPSASFAPSASNATQPITEAM